MFTTQTLPSFVIFILLIGICVKKTNVEESIIWSLCWLLNTVIMNNMGIKIHITFQSYIFPPNYYAVYKHENINFGCISVQLEVLMCTFAVSVQGRPFSVYFQDKSIA